MIPGEVEDCWDCLGRKAAADPAMNEKFFYLRRCEKCKQVYGSAEMTVNGSGEILMPHILGTCLKGAV